MQYRRGRSPKQTGGPSRTALSQNVRGIVSFLCRKTHLSSACLDKLCQQYQQLLVAGIAGALRRG